MTRSTLKTMLQHKDYVEQLSLRRIRFKDNFIDFLLELLVMHKVVPAPTKSCKKFHDYLLYVYLFSTCRYACDLKKTINTIKTS